MFAVNSGGTAVKTVLFRQGGFFDTLPFGQACRRNAGPGVERGQQHSSRWFRRRGKLR